MDDSSEHDEKFEDAEDSGDDEQIEQPKKTRKTASGRVIIKSKEGESYKALHELYCVLLGGDTIDADLLRDELTPLVASALNTRGDDAESIRAANELSVVPFGADTKGMIEGWGGTIHGLITVSHPNVMVMAALEHVTQGGDVSVLGAAIIAESYSAATARAQAAWGAPRSGSASRRRPARTSSCAASARSTTRTSTRTRTRCRRPSARPRHR
jgi:hypothetical protein